MGQETERSSASLEENLKKALTELLVLRLFSEGAHYIGELTELIASRSRGVLTVVFPYAAFYRIYKAGLITEEKKRTAPDGRLRQYYQITEAGLAYLDDLLETYAVVSLAVSRILHPEEGIPMNDAVLSYGRSLRNALPCSPKDKRRCLTQFRTMVSPLLEEDADPTEQVLSEALGTPEQLARTLLDELPKDAVHEWQRTRRIWLSVGAAVMITVFAFLIYCAAMRPIGITYEDTIIIEGVVE